MLVGAIIGFGLFSLFSIIIGSELMDMKVSNKAFIVIMSICLLLSISVCGVVGNSINNTSVETEIAQFESTKTLYNNSLNNPKLNGFEINEIVKMANEQNQIIIKLKIDSTKWWNIGLKQEYIDKLTSIAPIY